jgi:dihydroxyacid dehydratase/phosphogluconate dehydratase
LQQPTPYTEAEGTSRELTTISVSDVITQGHEGIEASLISRADSIEMMAGLVSKIFDVNISTEGP